MRYDTRLVFIPRSIEFLLTDVNIVKLISIRQAVPNYTVYLVIHSFNLTISNYTILQLFVYVPYLCTLNFLLLCINIVLYIIL